jgi:hypothetical protein
VSLILSRRAGTIQEAEERVQCRIRVVEGNGAISGRLPARRYGITVTDLYQKFNVVAAYYSATL